LASIHVPLTLIGEQADAYLIISPCIVVSILFYTSRLVHRQSALALVISSAGRDNHRHQSSQNQQRYFITSATIGKMVFYPIIGSHMENEQTANKSDQNLL
jgi:hypothetical protein